MPACITSQQLEKFMTANILLESFNRGHVPGINALFQTHYNSDTDELAGVINGYFFNPVPNSMEWFNSEFSDDMLSAFYKRACNDVATYLSDWLACDQLGSLGLNHDQQIAVIMYGLDPTILPPEHAKVDIELLQKARRIVLIGWLDIVLKETIAKLEEDYVEWVS